MAHQDAKILSSVIKYRHIYSGVDKVYCTTVKGQAKVDRKPHLTCFAHCYQSTVPHIPLARSLYSTPNKMQCTAKPSYRHREQKCTKLLVHDEFFVSQQAYEIHRNFNYHCKNIQKFDLFQCVANYHFTFTSKAMLISKCQHY